jgi:hypothetical protein
MSILDGLNRIKSEERIIVFKERMLKLEDGNEYLCLSNEYKNSKEKLEFLHIICGNKFTMTPDRLAWGNKCPICAKIKRGVKFRKDKNEILEKIYAILGKDYQLINFLNEYETVHSYLTILHKPCLIQYSVMARHILYDDNKCPKCSNMMLTDKSNGNPKSRGEILVEKILMKLDVLYSYNQRFTFNGKSYSFDFIVHYDDNSFSVIEFDGEQHFNSTKFKGTKQIDSDLKKNEYCKLNEIPLLRVPYYLDKNEVEELITKFLYN